jgi:VanZ family protein
VSRPLSFAKYWLPVIACMALIFSGSGDVLSVPHTSRILGPLIHWLFPSMPEETMSRMIVVIRKGGHMAEFGLLAWLVWRALRKPVRNDIRPWRWFEAGRAFGIAAFYAISDELHQSLVPSRQGAVRDVLVDAAGAATALLLLLVIGRWRKKW